MEELNEKLAKWAGFKNIDFCGWSCPDRTNMHESPDFCNDLNACFKWLVPKLDEYGLCTCWNAQGSEHGASARCEPSEEHRGYADTAALALCEAIEKLIDAEAT